MDSSILVGDAAAEQPPKFRRIVVEPHLADGAAAVPVYEGDPGFKRGYTLAYEDGRLDFAVMVDDPVQIYLHNYSSQIHADMPKHLRLYFRAVDARALHGKLSARGGPASALVTTDYGSIEFSLMGPEGYQLVFQQFEPFAKGQNRIFMAANTYQ